MSISNRNTKEVLCKAVLLVLGVAACFGGLWLVCTAASAVLKIAGVA